MILLEFTSQRSLSGAARVLDRSKVPYRLEPAFQNLFPHYIFFFEEDIRTSAQQEAFRRARVFEAWDRRTSRNLDLPGLAQPI